jgi:hypothetical protein
LSISSFPSASSSLCGTISQDVNAASLRIKLPLDSWPIQDCSKARGLIAKILCSGLKISANKETWELVTSATSCTKMMCVWLFGGRQWRIFTNACFTI